MNEHRQAENTDLMIDGCLFESNYASKNGGGLQHESGSVTVLGSVFYNSVAGSDDVEGGEVSLTEHCGRIYAAYQQRGDCGRGLAISSNQRAWAKYMYGAC